MTDYDVTIEFCNYNNHESFVIEADSEEEAKQLALEWAIDELSIVEIEKLDELKYLKFNNYILRKVDSRNKTHDLLSNKDIHYLIDIAEKISLQNGKKIEVIGTNENTSNYQSYSVLFTRNI